MQEAVAAATAAVTQHRYDELKEKQAKGELKGKESTEFKRMSDNMRRKKRWSEGTEVNRQARLEHQRAEYHSKRKKITL